MANIILVNNDKAASRVVLDLLNVEGHTTRHTSSAAGLKSMLLTKEADLILVGIDVDDEDGRTLCENLFDEKRYKHIPVVLISPFFHTENEVRKFHCVDVISIPLEASTILYCVEMYAAKKQKTEVLLENTTYEQ